MTDDPDEQEQEAEQARWDALQEAWETTEQKMREHLPPELRTILDRPLYYDPDGDPITMPQWAQLIERRRQETTNTGEIPRESWWCRKTMIGEHTEISTVWLGLDHNHIGAGPPLTWETMIFGGKWDHQQWRYHTRAQAYDHHEEIVRALRAGQDPNDA